MVQGATVAQHDIMSLDRAGGVMEMFIYMLHF